MAGGAQGSIPLSKTHEGASERYARTDETDVAFVPI
jgi:hypothetical protein